MYRFLLILLIIPSLYAMEKKDAQAVKENELATEKKFLEAKRAELESLLKKNDEHEESKRRAIKKELASTQKTLQKIEKSKTAERKFSFFLRKTKENSKQMEQEKTIIK